MPNPPGHRAEAEKKTSPLVAAGILTAANTEFFNTLSQFRKFRARVLAVRNWLEEAM